MSTQLHIRIVLALAALGAGGALAAGDKNDYPTVGRVEYVVACMREAPKASQEYLYKCSCVIDEIARRLDYDAFVNEATTTDALSIGGERGEVMRGLQGGRKVARHFHAVEDEARKACFMQPRS
jgi:hypothetical protein